MPGIPKQTLDEGLNYRRMWATLRDEIEGCALHDVNAIHPTIVLSYMTFIQRIAEFEKKGATNES